MEEDDNENDENDDEEESEVDESDDNILLRDMIQILFVLVLF